VAEVNDINHILSTRGSLVGKPLNLNLVSSVFHDLAFISLIEQVIYLSSVNFKETHDELSSLGCKFIEVIARVLGITVDSKCLS
jgi:hypothetical protein